MTVQAAGRISHYNKAATKIAETYDASFTVVLAPVLHFERRAGGHFRGVFKVQSPLGKSLPYLRRIEGIRMSYCIYNNWHLQIHFRRRRWQRHEDPVSLS